MKKLFGIKALAFSCIISAAVGCAVPSGGTPTNSPSGPGAKRWGTAALLEQFDLGSAQSPQIAIGGDESVFVVWAQYDGVSTGFGASESIWANHYIPGTGWSGALMIRDGSNANAAFQPAIAVDPEGNAIAVWQEFNQGSVGNTNITSIWAAYYGAGTGWGTPQLINSGDERAYSAQVGMDGLGNAIVVWDQEHYAISMVMANRFVKSGAGWGTPGRIDDTSASAFAPNISVDAGGNAVVVWIQGGNGNIWSNHFTAGTGWDGAWEFTNDGSGLPASYVTNASGPRVALNASGDGYAVWRESNGTSVLIRSKHFTSASGWDTNNEDVESLLAESSNDVRDPSIDVDAQGNARAAWASNDSGHYRIKASFRGAATGWGMTVTLDSELSSPGLPQVAVNGTGDGFVVWQQWNGSRYNIWSNHKRADDVNWGSAELAETDDTGSAYAPQVVVDSSGNAFAVWRQSEGTRDNIWFNIYK